MAKKKKAKEMPKKAAKKAGFGQKLKSEFTTIAIVMIPIAIAINQVGRLIHEALALPVYLDTIGTLFTAMLCGPWVAGIGGFLTNVVTAIAYGRATSVFFGTVQLGIGLLTGFVVYKGWLKKWWQVPIMGTANALVAALISAPIVGIVSGGVSGQGQDVVFAFFLAAGERFWNALFASRFLVELLDKAVISIFIPWMAVKRLPDRYAKLFKYAHKVRK
ncbi:MAG: ECF transporter S component [Candidatus Nanoarchaeia archaeon]|nr:ECF transporter S component [Candidatus Nanoarchaeia archaeon]